MAARIVRKPSKDMQKFLKAGSNGRLLGPVERFMKSEAPDFRRQDILHPSSMAKASWCPRAGYYQLVWDAEGKEQPKEDITFVKQNIFDEGHVIHDKWQERFRRMGILYGRWKCQDCASTTPGMSLPPAVCWSCGCKSIKYAEVTFEVPEYRIGGHADGWIKDSKPDCLIEIKSVGTGSYRFYAQDLVELHGEDIGALWRNTKRPFTEHINQGQIYLHLANLMWGSEAPQDIVFIYECKANQQVKEWVVPYSPNLVEDKFKDAKDIVRRIEQGKGAPECVTGHTCNECSVYAE